MPLLARILLAPLQRFTFAVPAHLASKHLWGAPSQAAIALCGIVASTSLTIAMAVMVSSFRGSVDDWLVQVLPADLYLRVEGNDNRDRVAYRAWVLPVPPLCERCRRPRGGRCEAERHNFRNNPHLPFPESCPARAQAADDACSQQARREALFTRRQPIR